jgi:hypothetical protein
MLLRINQDSNINRTKLVSFKGKDVNAYIDTSYSADKFVKDVEKAVEVQKKGDFISKYLWSNTALISAGLAVLPYEFYTIHKMRKLKKTGQTEILQAAAKSFKKVFPWLIGGALALYGGLEYLFSRNFDSRYEKLKKDFIKINTSTDAKLVDYTMTTGVMGALCSPISGEVVINKNVLKDPISRRRIIKLLKHELVHAKQYETIARSENGIKKLNYAVMKNSSKFIDNPQGRLEIEQVYNDINNDKTGMYENKTLSLIGADVNLKDYVTAIYLLLNNEDCSFDDIPIVIDEAHYNKVIKEKGKLSPSEEQKAELYYQAQLNYPKTSTLNLLNPFSDYYDNLLEKEAYKESPNFMTFVRKICGKQ